MKSRAWALILGTVLTICAGLSLWLLLPGEAAVTAHIYSGGALVEVVDLRVDQQFTVETELGVNVITVKDGKIGVTEADCPDHYCMQRGFCSSGTAIVRLPNKLVIEFAADQSIDGAVG